MKKVNKNLVQSFNGLIKLYKIEIGIGRIKTLHILPQG